MPCPLQILYKIQQGDNLYHLAKYFQTTVPQILARNPNMDPYNLKVGNTIVICPGGTFQMSQTTPDQTFLNCISQIELINKLRLAWLQHVYWTRMLLISIAEHLDDQDAVTNRLLQNPGDIAQIFASYYSMNVAQTIAQLLTEHLDIGAKLITALRDGNMEEANALNAQWYQNADQMAHAFSSINPYYKEEDIRDMLYRHLDMTKQEVAMRLAAKYPEDIAAFNGVEQEVLEMSDAFAKGIIHQFPQKFE